MKRLLVFAAFLLLLATLAHAAGEKEVVRLFYRMIGRQSNGPFPQKTRSVATLDGSARTASTGMADCGFTEYPFCRDYWSLSFRPTPGMYPRFANSVPIDTSRVNTCDILLDWVYEPDGCVWGPACAEFGQTFVATGRQLVSVSLLVASKQKTFNVAVHRDGPGGPEIAPRKTLTSGHSMTWGHASWSPEEALLDIGKTYYIRIFSDDREPFNPYFHAAGNACDTGCAFFDGTPQQQSDLALWIVNEPCDVSRAIILDADSNGWVRAANGVNFIAQTANIKMIAVDVKPVTSFCANVVAYVWKNEKKKTLLAGPKHNAACARADAAWEVSFLYTPGELYTTPGEQYYVELFTLPFEEHKSPAIGEKRTDMPKLDFRISVYGETSREPLPVISNVDATCPDNHTMTISWRLSKPAGVILEIQKANQPITRHSAMPGQNKIEVTGLTKATDYDFRLIASADPLDLTEPAASTWQTPLYRVRTPGGRPAKLIWPETPEYFLPLAPRPAHSGSLTDPFKYARKIELPGGNFEDHRLKGWQTDKKGNLSILPATEGITPTSGKQMYGFSHKAGKDRQQVFAEHDIRQTVKTQKGKYYALVADAFTDVTNGPRGDTRIRLAADPKGGTDLKNKNSSQWFWTDGKWITISHTFQARSDKATVAISFFRWRDLDRARAFADNIRLYELDQEP